MISGSFWTGRDPEGVVAVAAGSLEGARIAAHALQLGAEGKDWVAISSPQAARGCRLRLLFVTTQLSQELRAALEPCLL